ncbi:MAG: 5-(carboxyamino)imidazole ribonucleotide mutase [Parcubacteria group bacterium Gr01-1014_106]|nr:MAG: 5-(carboxyamino)imidazole ribonucleotide mutase [Parcubacteria group bacterium Gr01-1014_106]
MPYDVVIVLGSESDMKKVDASGMLTVLNNVGVRWELSVISAHRNPTQLINFVSDRRQEGTMVFIGIAGMAAALPGTLASLVDGMVPVLGVALSSSVLDGLDALLSQVRMPPGRHVAVCGIDEAGLYNAALTACSIVALVRPELREKLYAFLETTNKQPRIGLRTSDQEKGA